MNVDEKKHGSTYRGDLPVAITAPIDPRRYVEVHRATASYMSAHLQRVRRVIPVRYHIRAYRVHSYPDCHEC